MANPSGIVNGTGVILQVDTGSGYVNVSGEATHSVSYNTESIDTTNKSNDQVRTLLTGEGTQSIDITLDTLYSDDAAYQFLRAAWFSKEEVPVNRVVGGVTLAASVMVQSMSDTANRNESVGTSFTLQSTGSFTEA